MEANPGTYALNSNFEVIRINVKSIIILKTNQDFESKS